MARKSDPSQRHVVVAVVPDEPSLLELSAAVEVFGIDHPELAEPWYELRLCTSTTPWKRNKGYGLAVGIPQGLDALDDAHTVIAMPWGGEHGNEAPTEVLVALRAAYDRGARMLSFCTGAFLLAAAGVLDGRRATTHWHAAGDLAKEYPAVNIDPDVLYVDDGQVLTSAGSASSFDLALHVVRLDHGAEVANSIARDLVVPPHRDGGQAQYVGTPVARTAGPDPFHETLDWAVEHLDEPLSVGDLAARSLMSPRSFARKFQQVTGTSPHHWLLHQRVILAQRLLETTDDSVERIAQAAGFGSAATLRTHFQRFVHTSPLAYRRTFCGDQAVGQ